MLAHGGKVNAPVRRSSTNRQPFRQSARQPSETLVTTLPALLVNGSDREFRALTDSALTFAVRLIKLRDTIAKLIDLSGHQYHVLAVIFKREGIERVTVGSVAAALNVTGAYVTKECAHLARAGLIAKRTNPSDRRETLLSTTDMGRKIMATLLPTLCMIHDTIFRDFEPHEFRELCRGIGRLANSTTQGLILASRFLEDHRAAARREARGRIRKGRSTDVLTWDWT